MLNSKDPEKVRATQRVGVFFPNQQGTGTHIEKPGKCASPHRIPDRCARRSFFFREIGNEICVAAQ
jgi:hypothetical protein